MVRNKLRPMTSNSCVCVGEEGPTTANPPEIAPSTRRLTLEISSCSKWRGSLVQGITVRSLDGITRHHSFASRRVRHDGNVQRRDISGQDCADLLRVVDRVLLEPVSIA